MIYYIPLFATGEAAVVVLIAITTVRTRRIDLIENIFKYFGGLGERVSRLVSRVTLKSLKYL